MDKINKCPKCGGEMEKGKVSSYGGLQWGKGFLGLKESKWLKHYRCKKCGYIESYAK